LTKHIFPCKSTLWYFSGPCRAIIFPCQDFVGRAGPRFSVPRFCCPCRAINLAVHWSVPCHGVPAIRPWYKAFQIVLLTWRSHRRCARFECSK